MSVVASPRIASIHSTPHLLCDIAPDRDIVAVLAIGELDLATVPALDATLQDLRDAGLTALHLDLRSIGFIAWPGCGCCGAGAGSRRSRASNCASTPARRSSAPSR